MSLDSTGRSVSKFYELGQLFLTRLESFARTFRGSISGSVSEYPRANAKGRRAESDLARCSAIVSVARADEITVMDTLKNTNGKVLPSH